MSNQLPAVQGGKALPALPAHLLNATPAAGTNAEFREGIGGGFSPPRLSFKGSKFHIVKDGVETLVTKVDTETGDTVPVTQLAVVVLAANKGKYKTFYGEKADDGNWYPKAYDAGGDAEAPACYSFDGITPSVHARARQCESCAACPHNVFGSHITQQGHETRACSDNKLLAVIPYAAVKGFAEPDTLQGLVYSMKVPPTALSRNRDDRRANPTNNTSLVEYVDLLNRFPTGDGRQVEVPMTSVVTTLFFEPKAEYPLVRFKLRAYLTEAEIEYAQGRVVGDDVKAIVSEEGRLGGTPTAPKLAAPAPKPALAAPKPAPAPVAAAPQTAPAPRAVAPAPRPTPAPAPAAPRPAPAAVIDAFGEDDPPAPAAQAPVEAPKRRGRPAREGSAPAPAAPVTARPAAPAAPQPSVVAPGVETIDDDDLDAVSKMFGG